MTHHEIELPRHISRGAKGGSKFSTTVLQMASGREQRNINWSRIRGEWDIGYGLQGRDEMEEVLAFFHARWGKAHSFNFYDWVDHTVGYQYIGTGDGTTDKFQLFKRYQSGPYHYDYVTTKIIGDTFLGMVADTAGNGTYTPRAAAVDLTTGIVDLVDAPGAGDQVYTLGFQFYRPVRFDTDMLDVAIDFHEHFSVPQIPLVEVKL